MKNKIKPIISILLTLLLCFALTGCDMLDEMKKEQAFYTNEEKTEFVWQGTLYKHIEIDKDIFATSYVGAGYITESDIPVLLSDLYGDSFSIIEPYGLIMSNYGYYFCKAEEYGYYHTLAANAKLDKYAYITTNYVEDEDHIMRYEERLKIVTDKAQETIDKILAGEKTELLKFNFTSLYTIFSCDSTKTFYEDSFNLIKMTATDEYYLNVYNKINGEEFYKIPQEDIEVFLEIFEDIKDSKEDFYVK